MVDVLKAVIVLLVHKLKLIKSIKTSFKNIILNIVEPFG